MIHRLLQIERPLFIVDTETTGVDSQKDRIVEIGFQRWVAEGMTKEWKSLVNPGVPIPASATKVHGITDLDVQKCCECGYLRIDSPVNDLTERSCRCEVYRPWPTFQQLAANLAKGFTDCDFAGQNVRFDLRVMAAEMQRAGVEWSYATARIVDVGRLEALAVPRSLGHLHEKYVGHKHDGAHGALSDVRAAATVIAKQLETHPNLPRDLDRLHAEQWPNMIDADGRFRFIGGVACVAFGKWNGKSMKSVDSSYWDWICSSDFSAEVKKLARAAKLGRFPNEK